MPRPKPLEKMPMQELLGGREIDSASRDLARERNLRLVRRILDEQLGKATAVST
jgi:hypothetical protein